MDVAAWLSALGLGQYALAFRDNDIDASLLPTLTTNELRELGVASLGHRKRLLAAIAALPTGPTAATPERRQLTVMFVDLVGSAALSARLDPEDMRTVLRGYQDTVTGEVARVGGHVAKLMGDGVLAYFGWPHAGEDDAELAVRAGLAITRAVGRLPAPDQMPLAARVGIATGLVLVGELIGEGAAREESVVGDTPNHAARLQAAAAPGSVVVADGTRRLLGESFELRDLGCLAFKGVPKPVPCFEMIRERPAGSRFDAQRAGAPLPMVGRDQELALLLERWRRAITGEGQAVLLVGEPGIGKSRLVRALMDEIDPGGSTMLRCQCSPHYTGTPLWPVVRHLTFAAGFDPADTQPVRMAKLEALLRRGSAHPANALPFIAAMLDPEADPPAELTPKQLRDRTLAHLVDQVLGLARQQPVLMVVEDAHWVDPTTLELVSQTLDRIAAECVLVLLTSRPDAQPALDGHPHITRLTLNRLGRGSTDAIVGSLSGKLALAPEVVAEIAARSDGVPLFIEELTKAVVEADVAGPQSAVPATLQASLLARLDRVRGVKEAAQVAACIGREFAYPLLAAVWSSSPGELDAALDRLLAAELVFRRGAPPEVVYTYKHALVRDAAYESLLRSQRQALHGRIASALEEHFPETVRKEPELLARHCADAGFHERAVDYRYLAGQQAIARCSMAEAATQLAAGLASLEHIVEGPDRQRRELALQLALGQASIAARGFAAPETGEAHARARELCRGLGDPPALLPILYGQSVFHMQRGELITAYDVAEELQRAAERQGDSMALVTAHRMMGSALTQLGRLADSRQQFEIALSLHDPERHQSSAVVYAIDLQVMCLSWLSHVLHLLGEPDRALDCHRRATACAEALAHPSTSVVALAWGCIYLQLRRDHRSARAQSAAAIGAATEHGFPLYRAAASVVGGWARAQDGQFAAGLAEIRRGMADYAATGATMWSPYFLALLAEALGQSGSPVDGLECVGHALECVQRMKSRWIEPELHRLERELRLALPERQAHSATEPTSEHARTSMKRIIEAGSP